MLVSNRTIQFYFDKKREVVDSASNLRNYSGLQPYYHSERFMYIGSYQINPYFPYIDSTTGEIRRKYYSCYKVVTTIN